MLRKIYKVMLLLPMLSVYSQAAMANNASTVQWGCDAWDDSVCHFRIVSTSGEVREFEMPAGTKKLVENVTVGKDKYCICVNATPPEDMTQCKRGYQETFCKAATVLNGYNN